MIIFVCLHIALEKFLF